MTHHLMWSWPVYWYLFLAGTGAGAIAISAFIYLRGPGGNLAERYFDIAKYGAFIGPLPVIIGTGFLIFELGRPFRAFNIMTSNFWFKAFNPSPMNYGGWLLLLVGLVSVFYALSFVNWKAMIAGASGEVLEKWSVALRKPLAGACAPLAIATAVYTAMLLGAMPSRPLWNTPVLWALFTISALSSGIAAIMLANRIAHRSNGDQTRERLFHNSGYWLTLSDTILIMIELLVIALFFMFAYVTVQDASYAIKVILPSGQMGPLFWTWVVLIGLLMPLLLEAFFLLRVQYNGGHFRVPYVFEVALPLAILVGGFMLRYVIVVGGQLTGPIGL
ncbi:MAG: NrfD/PsrC family molybdoenzyme membrane anchor subunit [Motiliproteus sp.]